MFRAGTTGAAGATGATGAAGASASGRSPRYLVTELTAAQQDELVKTYALQAERGPAPANALEIKRPRVGLYRPWMASMDEGWTRWMLERYGFAVVSLYPHDFREATLDYAELLKITRVMTRDQRAVEQMFTRMVFNARAMNRDDHLKNYAFLMDPTGTWHLSPAYDVSFSSGPAGEHTLLIGGEGRHPGRAQFLDLRRIMAVDHLFDRFRAGHRRFLAHQRGHRAEGEAADMPQRRQQGRPHAVLRQQAVEGGEMAVFLCGHVAQGRRAGRLAEHGKLAGIDALGTVFAGMVDAATSRKTTRTKSERRSASRPPSAASTPGVSGTMTVSMPMASASRQPIIGPAPPKARSA